LSLVTRSFIASKKLYALDLDSFEATVEETRTRDDGVEFTSFNYHVNAVWFRKRRNGRVAAFYGTVGDRNTTLPNHKAPSHLWDLNEFLMYSDNGLSGGRPLGCWDGQGTWWDSQVADDFQEQQRVLPMLQDMLNNHPDTPAGYTGWYYWN